MEDPHFHQAVDEYIFFISADPTKPEEFDAEIEFMIGDDPDHMESRMITKPTVVRLPPNVWHCPIKFRKMNKPLIFQAAFLNGTWGTIVRKKNTAQEASPFFNREYVYEYMGDNVRFCKFNKQKRCNICGACFQDGRDRFRQAGRGRKEKARGIITGTGIRERRDTAGPVSEHRTEDVDRCS